MERIRRLEAKIRPELRCFLIHGFRYFKLQIQREEPDKLVEQIVAFQTKWQYKAFKLCQRAVTNDPVTFC